MLKLFLYTEVLNKYVVWSLKQTDVWLKSQHPVLGLISARYCWLHWDKRHSDETKDKQM